jgi:hypothetical protein
VSIVWPATAGELESAGYVPPFDAQGVRCQSCATTIQFWGTPNGRKMPIERLGPEGHLYNPHWMSCPGRDQHKKTYVRRKVKK